MEKYKQLTFLSNKARQRALTEYREKLKIYFENIDYDQNRDIIDTDKSSTIRTYLNKNGSSIVEYLTDSGNPPFAIHTAPPMLGARTSRINLIENLFNIQNFDIEPQAVIDFIDQSLGTYEKDFNYSVIRTFNPFFWISKALEFVASIPFIALGELGLNQKKIEDSFMGKFIKLIIKFISVFTLIWQFLVFIGIIPQNLSLLILLTR